MHVPQALFAVHQRVPRSAVPPTDWKGDPADDNVSPHLLFVSDERMICDDR